MAKATACIMACAMSVSYRDAIRASWMRVTMRLLFRREGGAGRMNEGNRAAAKGKPPIADGFASYIVAGSRVCLGV